MDFRGVGEAFIRPDSTETEQENDFSVFVFFQRTGNPNARQGIFIDVRFDSSSENGGYLLDYRGDRKGQYRFGVFNDGNTFAEHVDNTTEPQTLCGTSDGSTLRLYQDGSQVDTAPSLNPGAHATADLKIGVSGSNPGFPFEGYIQSALLVDRTLTSNEVKYLNTQARRGFPDLLNRRSDVGLLGGGGGTTIIVPNDVTHDHGIDASTVNVSYGLSPSDTTQGQSIGAAGLNVAYTLSPNALKQGHTLGASALSTGVVLTPNDVQHGHTLDPSSVAVAFTLSPNDAGHTHTLNAGGVNVAYALTPNRLQQGHTLANTGLDTGLVLFPNDVQHGHTLEASSVTVAFTVSPNDSTQGHTLTGSGLDVTYALTPQGVQHAHRIAETGASVAYTLSPSGLLHPQSVGVSGVSVTYVLSPNDAQHEHLLGTPVLIVKGNAERASLEAVPLYQISLSATPIIKDN